MPFVIIDPPRGVPSPPLEVSLPNGGALVDVCDDHHALIPFSCKSANCGTCRIDVLEGASELVPPADDELDLLDIFAAPPTVRLACQAKMKPGLARLRIRAVDVDGERAR